MGDFGKARETLFDNRLPVPKALRRRSAIVAGASLLCGCVATLTAPATAGMIASGVYNSVGSAGNASATVIDASPSFNITSLGKSFTSIGPLDFQFPVNPSGGTITYFVTEGITNNTNVTWSDYHEQLGTGVGASFGLGSPVAFLLPPDVTFTNPAFPSRSVTASDIDYEGGAVAPGQAITLTFSITVPDVGAAPYAFTLREFPTVPEPVSLSMLALGSIGLLTRRPRH
jgi:hypothetical protein